MSDATMRFGLVGTGPWATMAHGPGLVAAPGAELVGVWGRSPDKTQELAHALGTTAYGSYDDLLAAVDAVAFAVPPAVQARLAVEAARLHANARAALTRLKLSGVVT